MNSYIVLYERDPKIYLSPKTNVGFAKGTMFFLFLSFVVVLFFLGGTEFFCVTLAVLELPLETRLALISACLCLSVLGLKVSGTTAQQELCSL